MRILWIGDACCHSGFAVVTRAVLGGLQHLGHDCHCLAINYWGDPHRETFPCYPASSGGDPYGLGRYQALVKELRPDVVGVLQDPWIAAEFAERKGEEPMLAYMPVDGLNVARARDLNALDLAVFYTQFGRREARKSGYTGPAAVIPHGVDIGLYTPMNREACRASIGVDRLPEGAYVVGCVNRNQPRKRLDLTVRAFARWVKDYRPGPDVHLWLHCAPKDRGWDVEQLAAYYGVVDRLIFTNRDMHPGKGVSAAHMALVYNAFDVQLNTSMGEGWGLPQIEGMACAIPQLCGDWAALSEWAKGVAYLVPCTSTMATPEQVNVIGGVPDEGGIITALEHLHEDAELRAELGRRGLVLAGQPRFRWEAIVERFHQACVDVASGELGGYEPSREG